MKNTENTASIVNPTTRRTIELEGDLEHGLTAAQLQRVEWLDAELADGVGRVYIFGANPRVEVPAGMAYVETAGHPESRLVIEVNRLGGMEVNGSAADVLEPIVNNAPAI